jgi:hypothetical protein
MRKPKKQKPTLRLTAIEIQRLKRAAEVLDGKYGEIVKVLLRAIVAVEDFDREKTEELLRRVSATLRGEKSDEYGSPRCGHA